MTLYARGYRRYEDGFHARRLRFGPIFVQGYREAIRSKAFRRLMSLFTVILIVHCMMYYFNPDQFLRRLSGTVRPGSASSSETLRASVGSLLGALKWLSPLLVLFVGSGLVADDLRTRALPLYLVRPITPVDYWLGKWLIPAAVLAVAVLFPLLVLLLFGVLLEPSDQVFTFAAEQGRLALAILAAYAACAVAYGSLVVLLSTIAGRRTTALVLGAATIYGAQVVVHLAMGARFSGRMPQTVESHGLLDLVKTVWLPMDVASIFHAVSGTPIDPDYAAVAPDPWSAVGMLVVLFFLAAFFVVRRARSVEVVA